LTAAGFKQLYLSELVEENNGLNLASRPVPVTPHHLPNLQKHYSERDRGFSILISAQPSRSVPVARTRLPCPVHPQPRDYQAIDKLQIQHTPVALKYQG